MKGDQLGIKRIDLGLYRRHVLRGGKLLSRQGYDQCLYRGYMDIES
jgi:hypothetical protein